MGLRVKETFPENIEQIKRLRLGINYVKLEYSLPIPFDYRIVDGSDVDSNAYAWQKTGHINKENPVLGVYMPIIPIYLRSRPRNSYIIEIKDYIYTVVVWEGVPDEYKPILVMHQLIEHGTHSHELATKYEIEFARQFLGEEKFHKYLKWRKECVK